MKDWGKFGHIAGSVVLTGDIGKCSQACNQVFAALNCRYVGSACTSQ